MSDVDIRREKLVKQFKFGGLALPMVAAGTVVAAGIAVVGGIVLVNFIPVISMKAANRRLKAMKAEARENPIETAENQLVKMSQQLDAFQQDTASYLAKGKALIDDLRETDGSHPAWRSVNLVSNERHRWDAYVGKQ